MLRITRGDADAVVTCSTHLCRAFAGYAASPEIGRYGLKESIHISMSPVAHRRAECSTVFGDIWHVVNNYP
jgi:hypothetical protein